MEQLTVIATEGDTLVLATESGGRFALPLDDALRAELRRARREPEPRTQRATPREIQAHIRAGLTVEDVASLLAVRREDVEKYERPVMAEREHMVGRALAVPVILAGGIDPSAQPTFGTAVRGKLADAGAVGERWTSWKEAGGWVVKVEFAVGDVEHDARWTFDPRRSALAPQNPDAVQLSRQGSLPDTLIPRLRALDSAPAPAWKDESRFDSGAFGLRGLPDPDADIDVPEMPEQSPAAVHRAAIHRAPEPPTTSHDTADLLEALRRRRGQRDPLPGGSVTAVSTASAPVALFDALEPGFEGVRESGFEGVRESARNIAGDDEDPAARRRGRSSMPSWDEIVFGARTDD